MQKKHVFILILILALLSIVVSHVSAFRIRSTWSGGQKYVYMNDVARFYGMNFVRNKHKCTLFSKYSKVVFNYNSNLSMINGVKTYISFPVKVINIKKSWIVLLSEKDFLLLLDPILRGKTILAGKGVKTVVIDPGHGGKDSGTRGAKFKEKDIVLQVARRLSIILEKAGYNVVMTRNSDVFVSLGGRAAIADKFNGDLFVSLHCNSGSNRSTTGIETWIYTPEGTASTYGGLPSAFQNGNKCNKYNAKLAYEIQKNLNHMGSIDRGIKHSKFKVLRLCSKPAVLLELGFLSSPTEEAKLASANYQYLLAYRIAQGIAAYSQAAN
jgi:N-acetylmuramoyl-L-alanine amidase